MLTSPHIEFLRTIALDSALQTVKCHVPRNYVSRLMARKKENVKLFLQLINIAHDQIIYYSKIMRKNYRGVKTAIDFCVKKNFQLPINFVQIRGKSCHFFFFFFDTETSQNLSRKPNSEQAIFQKASVRNVGRSRSMHSESLIDGGAWPDCADTCKQLCSNIV